MMKRLAILSALTCAVLFLAAPAARADDLQDCSDALADIRDRCQEQNAQRFDVAADVIRNMLDAGHEKKAAAHAERACSQLEQHTSVCIAQIEQVLDRCARFLDPAEYAVLAHEAHGHVTVLKRALQLQCLKLLRLAKAGPKPKPEPGK